MFGIGDAIKLGGQVLGMFSEKEKSEDKAYHYKQQSRISKETAKKNAENIRQAAKRNAELSIFDAKVALREAEAIQKSTMVDLRNHIEFSGKLLGSQRAAAGKSGIAVGTGTPLEVEAYTKGELMRDAIVIRYNGMKASQAAKTLAKRYKESADMTLENAAEHAALIEEAGVLDSNYYGDLSDSAKDEGFWNLLGQGAELAYDIFK